MRAYEIIALGFTAYGYNVKIDNSKKGLSVVKNKQAVLRCGDGRPGIDDPDFFKGPTVFGGTPGHATMRALSRGSDEVTWNDLDSAINLEAKRGYVSSTHNIHLHDVHCAQQGGMENGSLGMRQDFSAVQARDRVLENGGVSMTLLGEHKEKELLMIMADGMTHVPVESDQKFSTSVWWLLDQNISSNAIIVATAKLLSSISNAVPINTVRVII